MAEIDSSGGGGKGGKQRAKKQSTKIDMTPMVDLGFLLITFFMLTTTLQKPSIMQLNMPDKTENKEDNTKLKASETLAIIAGPKDKIYWFNGDPKDPNTKIEISDYSADGIRKVIAQKKAAIGEKFVCVIMPMDNSNYKNVVDILDEMAVTGQERYAMVDIAPTIIDLVKKSGKFVE